MLTDQRYGGTGRTTVGEDQRRVRCEQPAQSNVDRLATGTSWVLSARIAAWGELFDHALGVVDRRISSCGRVSRCPRGPRSGADVGREVLAGEGGAGGDEVGGCALEDDPATVVAGAGAEVDDPVGVRHDRLVVRDDDDRLAGVDEPVEQAEQLLDRLV